jgi:cytochrome c biogenesis protein CcdA
MVFCNGLAIRIAIIFLLLDSAKQRKFSKVYKIVEYYTGFLFHNTHALRVQD